MKSIIVYASYTKLSTVHVQVRTELWIRTEVVQFGVERALQLSKPREGEILLNTIPYGEGDQS